MGVVREEPGAGVDAARPDPEWFGPYRLDGLIGRGGMGEVHRAYDVDRDRVVALKLMPRHLGADPAFRHRFEAEARIAARMRNPHVIPIHDYGEIDGRLFIDMRLVDGVDLKTRLEQERRLAPGPAVAIAAQLAGALDAAHREGLVHRDVKPSNVLTVDDDFVYLIDFGLARELAAPRMTVSGITLGTLAYMAPERFDGLGDHTVDVYALACMLHEMLTGQPPFPVQDFLAIMNAHATTPPPRPSRMVPGVPPALDEVVARGLAKDPARRYRSAAEFAAAAKAALTRAAPMAAGPSTAPAPPTVPVLPAVSGPQPSGPTPVRLSPREQEMLARGGRRPPGVLAGVVLAGVLVLVIVLVVVAVLADNEDYADSERYPATDDGGTESVSESAGVPAVVGQIKVGNSPRNVALSADGQRLYATNRGDDTVSVVDTATDEVVETMAVGDGSGPEGIALTPDGRTSFVVDNDAAAVDVIDNTTGTVRRTIPVSVSPTDVAVGADGKTAYVTTTDGGALLALDTREVVKAIGADGRPQSLALSSDGRTAYVTDGGTNSLLTVDTTDFRVIGRIPVGAGPDGVALSPDGQTAYVVDIDDNALSVVNLAGGTVVATIAVGQRPISVAVHPDGRTAYVTNNESGSVSVIDTGSRSLVGSVSVGSHPEAVAMAPDGSRAYVVNSGDGTISVLDPTG
jgi:serine/threonine-protein kinase